MASHIPGVENVIADLLSRGHSPPFHPGSGFDGTNREVQTTAAVDRYVGQQETRLDLADLEKDVQKYFEHGLAGTTRRTYQSGINKFVHFCNIYHSGALRTGSSCFARAAPGAALSHNKQEAGCIYVNNAGPWNAIMHLDCTVPKDRLRLVLVLTTTLSLVLTFFG